MGYGPVYPKQPAHQQASCGAAEALARSDAAAAIGAAGDAVTAALGFGGGGSSVGLGSCSVADYVAPGPNPHDITGEKGQHVGRGKMGEGGEEGEKRQQQEGMGELDEGLCCGSTLSS